MKSRKKSLEVRLIKQYKQKVENPLLVEQKRILEEKRSMNKPLDPNEFKEHLNKYTVFQKEKDERGHKVK